MQHYTRLQRPLLPFLAWPEGLAKLPFTHGEMLKATANSDRVNPNDLFSGQQAQMRLLLEWAVGNSPWYRKSTGYAEILKHIRRNKGEISALWSQLPILTKPQLRAHGASIHAMQVPQGHKPLGLVRTSGSTGIPVEVRTTALTRAIWSTLTVREHLWSGRDFTRRHGFIRHRPRENRQPEGRDAPNWGPPVADLYYTGPASAIHTGHTVETLAVWLKRFDPHYLLAYPSVVESLLDYLGHDKPSSLLEIRTISEPLDTALEQRLVDVWQVACTDIYSANEVGYIAFRCKEAGALHVQSEAVFLEVLDETGRACGPGETGRVVLTSLHNLATPLIRYEIGDYATVGEPCACGRTSMVLEKVKGRVRNLVRTPDGRSYWPGGLNRVRGIAAIRQAQYVQTTLDHIDVRVVLNRPFEGDEAALAAATVQRSLDYPFEVSFTPVDKIERGPTGKFEEFLSLLSEEGAGIRQTNEKLET